jgi:hypothetical protein
MAILYPWASKEYLLWEMSLGQIIMYHNLGIDIKYNSQKTDGPKKLADHSHEELKRIRDDLRAKYGAIE